MKRRRSLIYGVAAACAMLVMILDARTALASAREGVQLCIRTVIPSLFPFFVLSGVINSSLLGQNFRLLQPLGRLCKIPKGAESLLVLGFLAGYPIGAQLIAQSCREGKLSAQAARRMLGFCNNAGPAFLFGMLSPLFANTGTVWLLWGIHILSAIATGCILPGEESDLCAISPQPAITITRSLYNAVRAMTSVCGWVVLFRVVLGFCNRWFLWLFPTETQVLFSGFLELANGCVLLQNIPQEGMRFLLAAAMLAFGGLCVGMQTVSVTEGIGTGCYFPGKVLQMTLCVLLCILMQPIIFCKADAVLPSLPIIVIIGFLLIIQIFYIRRKKVVAFQRELLYNTENEQSKGANYAVSQEDHTLLHLLPMGYRNG